MNSSGVYISRENVLKLFDSDGNNNKVSCRVPKCEAKLSGRVIGNMRRHILLKHTDVAKQMNLLEANGAPARKRNMSQSFEENSSDSVASSSFSEGFVSIGYRPALKKKKLDENIFVKGCIKLCTEENVSFRLFNSDAFRMITKPLTDALGISMNAAIMPEKISSAADKIREKIGGELRNTLFSLKIDAATKLERGLLGVNVQFLQQGSVQVRTLGVLELTDSHTGYYLKSKLESLLEEKYGLSTIQVYSVTTDNGANMIKAVALMEKDQQELLEPLDIDFEAISEYQDDFYAEVAEKLENSADSSVLSCVRCVAHTLQLVVADVSKICHSELKTVREFVKKMKNSKYRERYALTGTPRPLLDVVTRWMSTFLMLKNILDNMEFYQELTSDKNIEVELPLNIQDFILKYVQSFTPLFFATKCFQEEQLTMGDFFKHWMRCFMECQKLANEEETNNMATEIIRSMERRQVKLFENPTFLAAVYIDPRFNFFGSSVLTSEQKKTATDHIFKSWLHLKRLLPSMESNEPETTCEKQSSDDDLAAFFRMKYNQPKAQSTMDKTDEEIKQKILNLSNQAQLPLSENVIQSWEMRRYEDPQLFQLSQIILAVPPTQVSVERAFSALGLVLTARRNRLSDKTIDDLLVCKLNPDVFNQI